MFDSIDGDTIVPMKRHELDSSLAARSQKHRQSSVEADDLANSAELSVSDDKQPRAGSIDVGLFPDKRRGEFDSIGGGLIPSKLRRAFDFIGGGDVIGKRDKAIDSFVDGIPWNARQFGDESEAEDLTRSTDDGEARGDRVIDDIISPFRESAAKREFDKLHGNRYYPVPTSRCKANSERRSQRERRNSGTFRRSFVGRRR